VCCQNSKDRIEKFTKVARRRQSISLHSKSFFMRLMVRTVYTYICTCWIYWSRLSFFFDNDVMKHSGCLDAVFNMLVKLVRGDNLPRLWNLLWGMCPTSLSRILLIKNSMYVLMRGGGKGERTTPETLAININLLPRIFVQHISLLLIGSAFGYFIQTYWVYSRWVYNCVKISG